MELWKGMPVVKKLNEQLTQEVTTLRAQGILPTLAIVRVGAREDDISYERGAMNRCKTVGVAVQSVVLDADATEDALITALQALNHDANVHGILLFRPLPRTMNEDRVRNCIAVEKDIDGVTDASLAGVFSGNGAGYPPCTARACMEMLAFYDYPLTGKNAVVIGRSLVVGKPLAMMLLDKNATVTVCHTRTADVPKIAREADVLLVCAGQPKMVDASYMHAQQVVLDVGIHEVDGALCGDVDPQAFDIPKAITPVPAGVGTVTTSVLVKHVIEAAQKQCTTVH